MRGDGKGRGLFRLPRTSARRVADDIDTELAFHLEARGAELEAHGLSPADARAQARREFGDVDGARAALRADGVRHARSAGRSLALDELVRDVRYGWRSLRRNIGFSAVVVLTIALGIGATATIFGVVDAVLLRALPYAAPDRLVSAWSVASQAEYVALQEVRAFGSVTGYQAGVGLTITGGEEPVRVEGTIATASFFSTLGVPAALGRTFLPGEDAPGQPLVAVIGHELWRAHFGADPGVLGRTVRVNGEMREVVGVMPPGFRFPNRDQQMWVPALIDPAAVGAYWGTTTLRVIARLAPHADVAVALREVRAVATALPARNPLWTPDVAGFVAGKAQVVPLQESIVGDTRVMLLVLLGAVGCVLLVVCANVANLLLARGMARSHEFAVRTALGAGRSRLVRQLLTESILLAALGGVLGFAFAFAGTAALVSVLPPETPRLAEISVNGRVLAFALVAATMTGVLFGLAPAWRVARSAPNAALGGRGAASGARRRLAGALILAQTALAVVLVVGAGLLVQSFQELRRVDPGFRRAQVVAARVSPPEVVAGSNRRNAFYDQLTARVRGIPGIVDVAVTTQLPFDGGADLWAADIPTVTLDPNALPQFVRRNVTPSYFAVLEVAVRRGRAFTDADRDGAPLVAIIDEAAAAEFWPDADPIGQRIGFPWIERYYTIVGVVRTVKNNDLRNADHPALYTPFAQDPSAGAMVVARTTLEPGQFAGQLRAAVGELDPNWPVSDVRTMNERLAGSVAGPRLTTVLVGGFAMVALLLGAIGLYGVTAYDVTQRTREIGLRMALGARAGDVLRLVLRQGAALTLAGIAIGLAGAFAASRVLGSLLFGVSTTDPLTFTVVPGILLVVAMLATVVPARRASRVDPTTALRGE